MKSILAKIKANKFRSAMIGTCIFLFGFITVTVFSNINDTYAVSYTCPSGWKLVNDNKCCPSKFTYSQQTCTSDSRTISESTCKRYGGNWKMLQSSQLGYYHCFVNPRNATSNAKKECYICPDIASNTKYYWGDYSNSTSCKKVSKYTTESACTSNNNAACYLCGNSRNAVYRWGNYASSSNCVRQNISDSASCTSKNTKTLSATFNVTKGGTLNGNASGSCTTSQASPNSCKTTAPTATRSGYYLKGWSTSSSCTSVRTTSSNNSITLDNSFSGSLYTCWGEKGQDAGGYASGSSTAENPQPGTPGGDTSGETTTAYTRKIYNITYDLDGGKFIDGSTKRIVSALGDSNLSEPQTNPIKDGVKFKEWQLNGTKFDFGQKPTSDMTLKAVYEELTDEDKLYYCENGILDQSTKTCYNVMKQDESKGLYDHSIYTYKEGSTFCYAYDKENNKPGGVNFRVNDNDFNMDNYKTITGRQENDDYSSSGYPELETWVSSDTCLIATECTEASNINRPTCEVRVDLIAYSKDGTLIKSDDSNEDEINIPIDSNDNNSDKTNNEIDKNSKTGDALIQFVWIIGICALGYSIYYFKNKKQEN